MFVGAPVTSPPGPRRDPPSVLLSASRMTTTDGRRVAQMFQAPDHKRESTATETRAVWEGGGVISTHRTRRQNTVPVYACKPRVLVVFCAVVLHATSPFLFSLTVQILVREPRPTTAARWRATEAQFSGRQFLSMATLIRRFFFSKATLTTLPKESTDMPKSRHIYQP